MIYSVFVGKYENVNISKSDLKKLNGLGLKGFLFCKGDFYSLKVYSTVKPENAEQLVRNLRAQGLEAYIEINNYK